ncbi:hypothetical protein EON80_13175, partial [bacterium]
MGPNRSLIEAAALTLHFYINLRIICVNLRHATTVLIFSVRSYFGMKFFRFPLLSALLLSGATYAQAAPVTSDYAPGEILIRVKSDSTTKVRRFALSTGASTARTYGSTGWQRIKLPANVSVDTAIARFKKQSGVIAAEPNYKLRTLKAPNDPEYKDLFNLERIGASSAWNVTTGSSEVVVAVLDTGVKYDHPDLAANMWKNPSEVANNGKDDDGNGIVDDVYGYDAYNIDGNPMDDNGHGTHCAGVIGAVGNNKVGIAGINWKVKIMALKMFGADGSTFSSEAIDCYLYAIAQKKRGVKLGVISNSWGGLGKAESIRSVMQLAADNGIISICAAGNESTNNDLKYNHPSNDDVTGLVAVGATNNDDVPAGFSNYGKKTVDLFAPGVNVYSTWIGKGRAAYNLESGTSMATPHVAGAAALLLSQAPSLTPAALKARLLEAVDVLPQLKNLSVTSGRLSLAKLLSTGIYSVRGTVVDSAKKPLSGVKIYLNGSTTVAATSAVDGSYSIDGLKPGTYKPTAQLASWKFTPSPVEVNIAAGNKYVSKVDFAGKSTATVYSISGTVYLRSGTKQKPLKGARITVNGSTDVLATTDESGKYTITGRAAGTYFVFAELGNYSLTAADQISVDGSVKVVLPVKKPATATADFIAIAAGDFLPPQVTVTAPAQGVTYPQGALTKAYGTASDASGVASIDFTLNRVTDAGSQFYIWSTKTWGDIIPSDGFFTEIPEEAFLHQTYKGLNVSWTVELPTLTAGDYQFFTFPADIFGNEYGFDFAAPFTIGQDETEVNYPDIVINTPTTFKQVPSNTPVVAKGTAADDNGVDTVFAYLRRYDAQGRLLSYYNWVEKIWVSPGDLTGECYTTFDARDQYNVNWSFKLPSMAAG